MFEVTIHREAESLFRYSSLWPVQSREEDKNWPRCFFLPLQTGFFCGLLSPKLSASPPPLGTWSSPGRTRCRTCSSRAPCAQAPHSHVLSSRRERGVREGKERAASSASLRFCLASLHSLDEMTCVRWLSNDSGVTSDSQHKPRGLSLPGVRLASPPALK